MRTYRPDIDGLRAVAVLAVLVFHAFPHALPGGFVGVDVFFVISGFLITGILLREQEVSIERFYVRRVRRIFPALAIVLATTLVIGALVLLPDELRALAKHTTAGALFSSNLLLWRESGYFDAASETKPLLHLWSLGVEEQFYFAWPLFVALFRRRRSFVPVMALVTLASFAFSVRYTYRAPATAFYLPVSRLWELSVGGLLAAVGSVTESRRGACSWAGAALIVAALAFTTERAFPGVWALLPVLGTALLIAGGPATLPGRALSAKPAVAIGLISYPLYLWHWPLLSFERILVGERVSVAARLLACAVAVLLAWATYRVVELRVRNGPRIWRRVPLLLAGVGASAIVGAVLTNTIAGEPAAESVRNCPAALGGDDGPGALNYCRVTYPEPPVFALIGDSHAAHLFDALADGQNSWALLGNSSCPPLLGVTIEGDQKGCAEKFQRILAYLQSADAASVSTVFVTFYSGYALDSSVAFDHVAKHSGPDTFAIDGHKDRATKQALFERGLDAYVAALAATGKSVVLVEDVPEFPFAASVCAQRPRLGMLARSALGGPGACSLPLETVRARQADYLAMVRRVADAHGAAVVQTLDYVCLGGVCAMSAADGALLYDDSHHLSLRGGALVAPAARKAGAVAGRQGAARDVVP